MLAILDREASQNIDSNIDFSPDGQLLAIVCGGNEIYVWELPKLPADAAAPLHITAPQLTLQAGKQILGLAFSADSRELHSVESGASIVTWDATAREDAGLGADSIENFWPFAAKISPDATKVAFSMFSDPPRCSVWELNKKQQVFRLETAGGMYTPVFSTDGRRIALVRDARNPQERSQIVILDAQTGEPLNTIPVGEGDASLLGRHSVDLAFHPGGGQIAAVIRPDPLVTTTGPTRLMAWDAATGKQLFSEDVNASDHDGLDYSQDGASLVLATNDRPQAAAVFYDAATGERQRSIPLPASGLSYFITSDQQMFASFRRSESDAVFGDLATGQERLRLPGYGGASQFAISPDGSRLVLGKRSYASRESELTLWSLKSGRRLLAFNRPGTVSAISFSPDGNRLIAAFYQSGTADRAFKPIQIWDATPLPEDVAK